MRSLCERKSIILYIISLCLIKYSFFYLERKKYRLPSIKVLITCSFSTFILDTVTHLIKRRIPKGQKSKPLHTLTCKYMKLQRELTCMLSLIYDSRWQALKRFEKKLQTKYTRFNYSTRGLLGATFLQLSHIKLVLSYAL